MHDRVVWLPVGVENPVFIHSLFNGLSTGFQHRSFCVVTSALLGGDSGHVGA